MLQPGGFALYTLAFGPPVLVKVIAVTHFKCEIEIPSGRSCGEAYPTCRTWVFRDRVRPISPLEMLARAAKS